VGRHKINDFIIINSEEVSGSSGGNSIIILCLIPFFFVLSLQLFVMFPYVAFHATMMTLNISKPIGLVYAFISILQTFVLTPPHFLCNQNF